MRAVAFLLIALVLAPQAGAADLKDPTLPPTPVVTAAPHAGEHKLLPRVTAVFVSSTRRIAIFNDQPVHAGDSVGAYHIDEVTALGVRYSVSGHTSFAALESPPAPPH